MFYDAAKTIAVRNDNNIVTGHQAREDFTFPIRHHPRNTILQRLRSGQQGRGYSLIPGVVQGTERRVLRKQARRHVEAPPPLMNLFVSIFGSRFSLIQSLQFSIMLFVRPP